MTWRAIVLPVLLAIFSAACASAQAAQKAVTVKWLGHASFLITSAEGVRIVTDPPSAEVGYPLAHPAADIVLVSHEHSDHNAVETVRGSPAVIRLGGQAGTRTVKGITFRGIQAYHYPPDRADLAKRGTVTIFAFEVDGIRFCHLADLGRTLTPAQVKAVGAVDVLMVPVGGYYTIDPAQADRVIAQLKPKVAIPMHYRTAVMGRGFNALATLEQFLAGKPNVKRIEGDTVTLSKAALPKSTMVYAFLKYSQ